MGQPHVEDSRMQKSWALLYCEVTTVAPGEQPPTCCGTRKITPTRLSLNPVTCSQTQFK